MLHSQNDYDVTRMPEWPAEVRAETFRRLRADRGYSIDELAVTSGLTVTEIEDIEDGKVPAPSYLERVGRVLGLT